MDIRWKQRFSNLEKAIGNLKASLAIEDPSEVEKAGIIQFYELAFELSWKTAKDYLEEMGFNVKSPRETIKQAFQSEIIENGHLWIRMLEERNKLAHIYDEAAANEAILHIKDSFAELLDHLYFFLKERV